MKRFYLPFLLLMTVVIEGLSHDLLPMSLLKVEWMIISHWLFVFLVLITIFYDMEDTYFSLLYAILFGLMIDIVYTSVIGVYMFIYALVIYFIHGVRKWLHTNFVVTLLLCVLGIGLVDIGVYIVYFFIGVNDMLWNDYMIYRFVPTLIANVTFFALFYPLIKGRLIHWSQERFDGKRSTH